MKAVNKHLPWYWLCKGDGRTRAAFNCKEATRSPLKAKATVAYRNVSNRDPNIEWFIRTDPEHPDRDYKQFLCGQCGHLQSKRELDDGWDWSGPHCPNCENTGLSMFADVQDHAPVMNGKGVLLAKLKSIINKL